MKNYEIFEATNPTSRDENGTDISLYPSIAKGLKLWMKTDRTRTDIIDITFVFIFLSNSDSNTDSVNHVG
jgi:hypothetical protein